MYNVPEITRCPALLERARGALGDPGQRTAWPRSAKIKLTSQCNLRCVMCRYWRRPRQAEMDTAAVERLLCDLASLGCRKVHFSGGEVFTRRDLLPLIELGVGLGLKVNLTTNGTLITKDLAKQLGKIGVNSVAVSLDAGRSKEHDRLRGVRGAFRSATRGAAWVIERGRAGRPRLRINMVLTRRNYHELPGVLRLAGELGATEVHPMPVDAKGSDKIRLSKTHIRDFNHTVAPEAEALRRDLGFSSAHDYLWPFGTSSEDLQFAKSGNYARGYFDDHLCYVPWLHTFVDWTGGVYLCCMARGKTPAMGHVGEQSIVDVLAGQPYADARSALLRQRLAVCGRCDSFLAENRLLASVLRGADGEA